MNMNIDEAVEILKKTGSKNSPKPAIVVADPPISATPDVGTEELGLAKGLKGDDAVVVGTFEVCQGLNWIFFAIELFCIFVIAAVAKSPLILAFIIPSVFLHFIGHVLIAFFKGIYGNVALIKEKISK